MKVKIRHLIMHIQSFVKKKADNISGGCVISDCYDIENETRKPLPLIVKSVIKNEFSLLITKEVK